MSGSVNFERAVVNAMTIDVEDYFQVSAFAPYIDRARWDSIPCRVEANVERILGLLDEAGAIRQPGKGVVVRLVADALLLRQAHRFLVVYDAPVPERDPEEEPRVPPERTGHRARVRRHGHSAR